jgi:hypothetical protein
MGCWRPRVASRFLRNRIVRDLPEDVVQIAHRLDDLPHVQLLETGDGGDAQAVGIDPVPPAIGIAVGAIDVVPAVEGVAIPGVSLALAVDRPAVEQHDGDIDPPLRGPQHPPAQAGEVFGIEAGEIEAGPAVEGKPGTGAQPRPRIEIVEPGLVSPETDEVVPPGRERVQIALEVEAARALAVVHQVVPVMGARQVDGAPLPVLEIARVRGVDAERRHAAEAEVSTGGRSHPSGWLAMRYVCDRLGAAWSLLPRKDRSRAVG